MRSFTFLTSHLSEIFFHMRKGSTSQSHYLAQKLLVTLKLKNLSKLRGREMCLLGAWEASGGDTM